ncbi:MAG: hypothetical protein WBG90_05160 [Saonia sp.]
MSKERIKTNTYRHQMGRGKRLFIGITIGLLLVLIPFFFYSYRLFAKTSLEWDTGIFIIGSGGFQNLQYFAHALFSKLIFCFSFIIWYLTCKHWWRIALLVPIAMLLFQISGVINYNIGYIDEFDFWFSLPVVLPILAILIITSRKLSPYAQAMDLRDEIEEEISKSA